MARDVNFYLFLEECFDKNYVISILEIVCSKVQPSTLRFFIEDLGTTVAHRKGRCDHGVEDRTIFSF